MPADRKEHVWHSSLDALSFELLPDDDIPCSAVRDREQQIEFRVLFSMVRGPQEHGDLLGMLLIAASFLRLRDLAQRLICDPGGGSGARHDAVARSWCDGSHGFSIFPCSTGLDTGSAKAQ